MNRRTARAFAPANPDLANAAGVPAQIANEKYVESLARIVYYWGYPAVDTFGRTSMWQSMTEPGAMLGNPEGQFASIVRAYVPTQPLLDGTYELPNVQRA